MNDRRARFVAEYIIDLNGKHAAIRAGFSPKTAEAQASRLLRNVEVRDAIDAALRERMKRTEISADRVVAELAKLGFANMADYMRAQPNGDPYLDFSALSRDQAAALQEVTVEDYVEGRGEAERQVKRVKFKLADKRAALVDLGRHLGIFTPVKMELSGPDGGPIETRLTDERQRNLDLIEQIAGRTAGAAAAAGASEDPGEAEPGADAELPVGLAGVVGSQ